MTEKFERIGASAEAIDRELSGIGGWLILPVIGFTMGLIYFPVMLTASLGMYSEVAKAGYGSIHAIEPIVLIGLLCFMLYTATLFFRKKSSTPGTFIALIAENSQVFNRLVEAFFPLIVMTKEENT